MVRSQQLLLDDWTPRSFIERIIQAASTPSATLSDGRLFLKSSDLARPIGLIEEYLISQGCDLEAPLALECSNSVPGVLTLLALLARGTSCGLFPRTEGREGEPTIPRFFHHTVTVRSQILDDGDAQLLHPASFLTIRTTPHHIPLPGDSSLRRNRLLLRTSGSLGKPKLVVHLHTKLLANAVNVVERLGLKSGDRCLIPVPLAHMYGLGVALLPSLYVGASIELIERANMIRYLAQEKTFQPTIGFLTPSLCRMLNRPRSLPCAYRGAIVGGDRLSSADYAQTEAVFRQVLSIYGSTEMGAISSADANVCGPERPMNEGPALEGVQLRLDRHAGNAEHDPGCGELLCAHPYGFEGYVDDDGQPVPLSAEAPTGWFRTRDLVRLAEDGSVQVLGRLDHAVKRDGRLVMLVEVERALGQIPTIDGIAVVVGRETNRGRGIVAFYSSRDETPIDTAALWRACKALLPSYAVPDSLHRIPALPLLPSGKVDRRILQQVAMTSLPM